MRKSPLKIPNILLLKSRQEAGGRSQESGVRSQDKEGKYFFPVTSPQSPVPSPHCAAIRSQ
ncbi:hypothetical protein IQ227_06205 [Anabaena aphanizomenioides LEGE 00250]|uniref:Uncharacterized protein n=1 Tax=Sphaerospermopsis aphanizomenoides LEGE 00250 TaxID=2777972 RepID=A0ABR9VAW7_9CYAN|nr:hypothetical protein [Sphaerospermopsis aphanizomenoides]MBE9235638.1 hypothetical protein [Sphaerospermopsis aphanizomenoides LEGE 00250]